MSLNKTTPNIEEKNQNALFSVNSYTPNAVVCLLKRKKSSLKGVICIVFKAITLLHFDDTLFFLLDFDFGKCYQSVTLSVIKV